MNYNFEKQTEVWRDGEVDRLTVTMEFPVFDKSKAAKRINKYYARRNKRFVELCKRVLLSKKASLPDHSANALLRSRVTYNEDGKLSVITDTRVEFGCVDCPTPQVVNDELRFADIWDTRTGTPLTLSALGFSKRRVQRKIFEEIAELCRCGRAYLYPDAVKRAERHFSAKNIYISSSGQLYLFFQPNTIAPRGEGVMHIEVR